MDRRFHQRFTVAAKSGIALFVLLAFYFFWAKKAIVGLFLIIIVVGMIERVIHTSYIFRRVKPIDRIKVTPMKSNFGLSHYLLLEYGAGNLTTVMPENEQAFIEELKRRRTK